MKYRGLGISKKASKQMDRDNAKLNREIDNSGMVYWSDRQDPEKWESDLDYMNVVLIPRKWWSWTAWELAIGVRKRVRLSFNAPIPKVVDHFKEREICHCKRTYAPGEGIRCKAVSPVPICADCSKIISTETWCR